MGYDAFVHIDRKKYTEKTIEDLILMLGYEKERVGFIAEMMRNINMKQGFKSGNMEKMKISKKLLTE